MYTPREDWLHPVRVIGIIGGLWATLASILSGPAVEGQTPDRKGPSPSQVSRIDNTQQTVPSYIGVIFARNETDISSELPGVLQRYRVRLGDRVRTGQVVAQIDSRSFQQDLDAAKSSLRAALAEESKAQIEFDQAQQMFERRKQVAWALSKEELESLAAKVSLARANLDLTTSQTGTQAARVQQAQERLAKCSIRAPFAGRIARLQESDGAFVTPGTPVVRLVAADLSVRFAVPPRDASWLSVGASAEMVLEGNGRRLPLRIEHIAPEVDAAAGMIFVEAQFLKPPWPILAGVQPGAVVKVQRTAQD